LIQENQSLSQNLNQEVGVLKSSVQELTQAVNEKDALLNAKTSSNSTQVNAEVLMQEKEKLKQEFQ
jgi:hypothetical protein